MKLVKRAAKWLGRTTVYAVKSMKAHVAVVVVVLTWASTHLPAPWGGYAAGALAVLVALGVTVARRSYGTPDVPVGETGDGV